MLQTNELRHRLPPILQALQACSLHSRTPVTALRKKPAPYHSWGLLTEPEDAPGWTPFTPGDAIGGEEAHFCFRGPVAAPAQAAGRHLVCLVSTGATDIWNNNNPQFLAYLNGELVCGLDVNHTEFDLTPCARPGDSWQLGLYAYCNTPAQDVFLRVETAVREDEVTALYYDLKTPFEAMVLQDPGDPNALTIARCLDRALALLDLRRPGSEDFFRSVAAAREYLRTEFYEGVCGQSPVTEACVGHTHIDVAWLWTLAQTREKAIRSFATVNYLMDRYPEYLFLSSQPQLYDFVRRDCPALYEKIRARVAEGRWEPEGGMWLESDCNMASGESLVRQFLHGQGFFQREFGRIGHILWLPDAFGFSGALPQIMKQCGMRWFMTTKLAWNDTDCMPHDLTRWRGIDGTEVLAYFISTKNYDPHPDLNARPNFNTTYNGLLDPKQVMGCWQRFQDKDLTRDVLQCFGYGDGGGGPTAAMLETQRRLARGIPGVPRTRISHAAPFFDQLEQDLARRGEPLPCWSGEFYFEYHRGVFTSQARTKQANRRAEMANLTAETLAALAGSCAGFAYPAETLRHNWELTLLNQFHDILPGSALAEVYRVAAQQYDRVLADDGRIARQAAGALAARVCTDRPGVLVFNQLGFARDAVVALPLAEPAAVIGPDGPLPAAWQDGTLTFAARDLPAKGWRFYPLAPAAPAAPAARVEGRGPYTVDTPFYRLHLTAEGTLDSVWDKQARRELLPAGARANELQLFEDRPEEYDAWNIEAYYRRHRYELEGPVTVTLRENTPLRCVFRVQRTVSRSAFTQDIILYAHSRRIDFETWVDWQEEHLLLKAAFPLDIRCEQARYDIQFGSIGRDTHENTSWDAARFEVCAHKWADLSEPGYGAALLNDGRYGYDVHEGVLRLSLLRAPTYPDPEADRGAHHFTYALLPHLGDWRTGDVIRQGYDLNAPALALPVAAQPGGSLPPVYSQFALDAPNIILETVKQAEDGDGLILRLYEAWGARTRAGLTLPAGATAVACTPLETPLEGETLSAGPVGLELRPFELRTLRVRLGN